jgi:RNA polymerase sigma factor (sigma-70 family)
MSSAVSLNSKAIDSHECPDRNPEGRVEDYEGIFEALIAPMESRMMRCIWRIVRSRELAEDTLQEALTTIWKKLPTVRRHPNPQALILKICINAACDSLRRRRRSLRHVEISILSSAPAPSGQGAMSAVAAKEMEDEVLEAIGRLPRKQALAVLMRVIEGESFEVIARTLGCSEITARIHVSQGRARLRRWLAHLAPSAGKEGSDEHTTEQ